MDGGLRQWRIQCAGFAASCVGVCWKVWAQAICHRASVFKVAYAIGVLPRAKQFDPHLGFLGRTIDNVFLLGGTECFIVAPEFPVGRVSGLGV